MSDGARSLHWSRYKSGELASESSSVFELALPHHTYAEAKSAHCLLLAGIACPVRDDLLSPPSPVRLGQACTNARLVPVPEAPVNEDTPSLFLVCDVRSPRKINRTDSISSTKAIQGGTNLFFRSSVALTHGLHADRRLESDDVVDGR